MSGSAKIIGFVASLIAVVAITAVVTKRVVAEHWAANHPVAAARQAPVEVKVEKPAAPVEVVKVRPVVVEAASAASATEAKPAALDLAALVKGLTTEQRAKLFAEKQKQDSERFRLSRRYKMQSDDYLMAMNTAANKRPELKLTDDQQAKLQAVQEAMKTKLNAELSGVWGRMDELLKEIDAKGQSFDARTDPSYKLYLQLNDQAEAVKTAEENDYEARVKIVLSVDQQQFVDDIKANINKWTKGLESMMK